MAINTKNNSSETSITLEQKKSNKVESLKASQEQVSKDTTSYLSQSSQNSKISLETVNLQSDNSLGNKINNTGEISKDEIDFNAIATSSANALNGKFVSSSKLHKDAWENNGKKLEYKLFPNGSVLILKNGTALGWTTEEKIFKNQKNELPKIDVSVNSDLDNKSIEQLNNNVENVRPIDLSQTEVTDIQSVPSSPEIVEEQKNADDIQKSAGANKSKKKNPPAWAKWRQYEGSWSSIKIGKKTVAQAGCLLTSLAIQMARSGTVPSNFNPGVFVKRVKKVKGLNGVSFGGPSALIRAYPNVYDAHLRKNVKVKNMNDVAKKMKKLISDGYYVVLKVKYNSHWVAVTRVDDDGNIYIVDPAASTKVGEVKLTRSLNKKYNIFDRKHINYYCFKVKKNK